LAATAQYRLPAWRKVGSMAVDLNLASPATGPVKQVWYSDDSTTLFAKTVSDRVFATVDFESWRAIENPPEAPAEPATAPAVVRLPEAGARLVAASANTNQI